VVVAGFGVVDAGSVTAAELDFHAAFLQYQLRRLDFSHRILASHSHHAAFRSIVLEWIFAEIESEMAKDMEARRVKEYDIRGNGKSRGISSN
jgi:hypothetical protein